MHTYGGKPFLMYNTALQLQETICAACLKADDSQHHQLLLRLSLAVKDLQEIGRRHVGMLAPAYFLSRLADLC